MNNNQVRINLDWCRGIAALLVAAMHCREIAWIGLRDFSSKIADQNIIDILFACIMAPVVWGSAGVSIFFVLSGYVIHIASVQKVKNNKNWKIDVKNFYLRRFIRIYPVLLSALILTFVLDSISKEYSPQQQKLGDLSFAAFWGNIFTLQGIWCKPYGSNGPLWTIGMEVHFYLLYPFLLKAKNFASPEKVLFCSAIGSVAAYYIFKNYDMQIFLSYYFLWVLGFYAAEMKDREIKYIPENKLIYFSLIVAASGCGVFFASGYWALVLWAVAFFLYLNVLIRKEKKSTSKITSGLTLIGVFSYTLYAVHEPIIVFLVGIFNSGSKHVSMTLVILYLVISMAISYVMYLIVERPTIKFMDNIRKIS